MKWIIGVGIMSLVCLTTGCNRGGPSAAAPTNAPAAPPPIPEPTGPFAAGQKVYNANCGRCHGFPGQGPSAAPGGPRAMGRGPNLGDVGTKRSRDWIVEHIKNPKTHSPQSRMPTFESRLKPDDLNALADYLVSLK
jgi:mono/diheme cytochrome c family protein